MIVVAFKTDDAVYMASCSSPLTYHSTSYVESNMPIWAPSLCSHALIGYTGDVRPLNVVRNYKQLMSDQTMENQELSAHYIVRHVYKNVIANLMEAKLIADEDCTDSIFGHLLIANKNKLFKLDMYGCVREISDYMAIGVGFERAMAGLEFYKDIQDPILKSLKVMCDVLSQASIGDFPIIIRNTKEPNKVWAFDMEAAIAYIHNHEHVKKGASK